HSGLFVLTNTALSSDIHSYATPPLLDKTTAANFTVVAGGLDSSATYSIHLDVPSVNGSATESTTDTVTTTAPASQAVFTTDPASSTGAGSSFSAEVSAEDPSGTVVADFSGSISVALTTSAGGATLAGSASAAPGTAPTGCSGSCAPTYGAFGTWASGVASASVTLYAGEQSRSLTVADGTHQGTSNTFDIGPASLDDVGFSQQPGGSPTGGIAFPTQPIVLAQDLYSNGVGSVSIALTITPSTGSSGATLSCASTTKTTGTTGTASFSGCNIDKAGTSYQLRATAATLQADSSAFDVAARTAASLGCAQPPGASPTAGAPSTAPPAA